MRVLQSCVLSGLRSEIPISLQRGGKVADLGNQGPLQHRKCVCSCDSCMVKTFPMLITRGFQMALLDMVPLFHLL